MIPGLDQETILSLYYDLRNTAHASTDQRKTIPPSFLINQPIGFSIARDCQDVTRLDDLVPSRCVGLYVAVYKNVV